MEQVLTNYKTALDSGNLCASKFAELSYSFTNSIAGTKYRTFGCNLYNSYASVISIEYEAPGTRCNRDIIDGVSMPIFKF